MSIVDTSPTKKNCDKHLFLRNNKQKLYTKNLIFLRIENLESIGINRKLFLMLTKNSEKKLS